MTQVWDRIAEHLEKQFSFVKVYYYVVSGGVDALQMDCSCPESWKYVLMKCAELSHQGCDELGFTAR